MKIRKALMNMMGTGLLVFCCIGGIRTTVQAENVHRYIPVNRVIKPADDHPISKQNLQRAIEIVDRALVSYFTEDDMAMARFFNPETGERSREKGSVWMYTAAIEAVNAILHTLKVQQESGETASYDTHYDRYSRLLGKLYDNLSYYQGTFELTSFTQTKTWSVYGVHRASRKGEAKVAGIENVYDDQQWLARELLHSYRLTGDAKYLEEAEYLTEYVLDGWDSTRDANGKEHGGIPWGPGYVTKHACSNSPFVSSLVWLHELYVDSDEEITLRYISEDNKRQTIVMKKRDYYLDFAKKVYAWQKEHLLRRDGVYNDFMGGCVNGCKIVYEEIDGVRYRANTALNDQVGPAYSYNTGAMLSGAVDLYRVTKDGDYLSDVKKLSDDSFRYFATPSEALPGYYGYAVSGFNNWFNGILMRAYVEAHAVYANTAPYIDSFQRNLDYGYDNFNQNGLLPTDLLKGWENGSDESVEGMFQFAFAAEYALLAAYEITKGD